MTTVLLIQSPEPDAPSLAADFEAAGFQVVGPVPCAHLVRSALRESPNVVACWEPRAGAELLDAVRRVGGGDFQPGAVTSRPDELGLVAWGINDMADGLRLRERIREAFGRFVSPQVANEFIEKYARPGRAAELGGRRRDVVLLFSDLRDFTPLSESLSPEDLIEVLNGYFAEMVAAKTGIGYLIFEGTQTQQTARTIVGMIVMGLLWLAMDQLYLRPIERATIQRWGLLVDAGQRT